MPMDGKQGRVIFFSAGEPSGDQHAAALLAGLRAQEPTLHAVGFGGPRLQDAGCRLLTDMTAHAVMGFARPLQEIPRFYGLYQAALRAWQANPPAAVILIDYPGFNWHLAKAAKKRHIPVLYYGPPQIWGWARWRVSKLRRWVDHTFCWLPFEKPWLERQGCTVTYVGHPFFDEIAQQRVDEQFLSQFQNKRPLLVLLPGSRNQEVAANGGLMLRVAQHLKWKIPDLHTAVAAFRPEHAEQIQKLSQSLSLEVEVFAGRTPELIRAADCCLAVSGSVSLELLYHEKPTVIVYRINRLGNYLQSWGRCVKYITLVNLLYYGGDRAADLSQKDNTTPAGEQALFPEFLTDRDCIAEIATPLGLWLTDSRARDAVVRELRRLKQSLQWEGAVDRAACSIRQYLNR